MPGVYDNGAQRIGMTTTIVPAGAAEARATRAPPRELSIKDIADLTETRVQIESVAMRLAIDRGDLRWETGVLTAHHLLDRTPVVKDDGRLNEEWSALHRDFHQALLAGCDNGRLAAVAQALRDGAELYRRWYWVFDR